MSIRQRIANAIYQESSLSAPERWASEMFGGDAKITKDTALEVTACFSCVRILSEQIAILPLNVYKDNEDKGRERIKGNLHKVLNVEPNPYMTAYNFWRAMMFNLLLTGTAYAEIERDKKNRTIKNLWPIPSGKVTKVMTSSKVPQYLVKVSENEQRVVKFGNMLEIISMTPDGISTYEPIRLLAKALGLSKSAERYSEDFFKNGSHPSGIVTYPGKLKSEKFDKFKEEVKSTYAGLGKQHRLMLLEEGMTYNRISAPPNEGQMYESRKFQVIEIARFFNVPPHKLMEMDRATYSNIEEMNIQFVNDSLLPHLVNIRQAAMQMLLFDFEKAEGKYLDYDLNNLLRGRLGDRNNAYATARQWGWLSVNEIRAKENMSNIGPQGDIYLEPTNMQQAGAEEGGNS